MDVGVNWYNAIEEQLRAACVGVFCITPENQDNTWIHFEAGCLRGKMEANRVCPVVLGIDLKSLSDPLGRLQATDWSKEGVWKLLKTINNIVKHGLDSEQALRQSYEKWWPDLQPILVEIEREAPSGQVFSSEKVLEDILLTVRRIEQQVDPNPQVQIVEGERMVLARRTLGREVAYLKRALDDISPPLLRSLKAALRE